MSIERFQPIETVRRGFYVVAMLGCAAIDAAFPDDCKEDAAIKSRIYSKMTERPYMTEEELAGQLPLWEHPDELEAN